MLCRSSWAAVFGLLQVLSCCCAFGGYPGTFYQMMLRLNKERKYARTAPSPSRLWAVLNPAATLGSLSKVPLDSNRVVRRDLAEKPGPFSGGPERVSVRPELTLPSNGLSETASGGLTEILGFASEGSVPYISGELNERSETASGGTEFTGELSDSIIEGSESKMEESGEEPESLSKRSSEELNHTNGGSEPVGGGAESIKTESIGGSEPTSGGSGKRPDEPEPTNGESGAGSDPRSGGSDGRLEPVSGGSKEGSKPTGGRYSEGPEPVRGESGSSVTTSEGLEPAIEGLEVTSGEFDATNEGLESTSGGLEAISGELETTGRGSELVNESLSSEEGGVRCGGELVMESPPPSLTPTHAQGYTLKQNLSSPGWEEGRYPEEVDCVWNLKVGPECEVGLLLYQVLEGEVLQSPRCLRDYLEFVQPNSHAIKYCGPLVTNKDKVSGMNSWHSSQERTTTIRFRSTLMSPLGDLSLISGTPRGFVMEVTYYCWLYNKKFMAPKEGEKGSGDEGGQDSDRRRRGSDNNNANKGSGDNDGVNGDGDGGDDGEGGARGGNEYK